MKKFISIYSFIADTSAKGSAHEICMIAIPNELFRLTHNTTYLYTYIYNTYCISEAEHMEE